MKNNRGQYFQLLTDLNRALSLSLNMQDSVQTFNSLSELDNYLGFDSCLETFKVLLSTNDVDEGEHYLSWDLSNKLDGKSDITLNLVFKCAKNKIYTILRKKKRDESVILTDHTLFESVKDSQVVYNDAEYNEHMLKALLKLDQLRGNNPERGMSFGYAVMIERLKGLSFKEISQMYGKSIDTVSSSFYRAYQDFSTIHDMNPSMEIHYA